MSRDKQNIKTTDWLTRGMTEEEIAKEKEEAIKEAEVELRDKQIEEMAKIMCGFTDDECEHCNTCSYHGGCACEMDAEALYNAGYRKSKEVAREIFEEIDKMLDGIMVIVSPNDGFITTFRKTMEKITAEVDELKKKYTEEGK